MAENYSIKLGIDFNDSELKNIKKQLTNLTDNTHRVRIDIDNSRLLKQIEHAKKELRELNSTKGNQPSLTVNTQSLEKSLSRVADVIEEVRKSLETLDDKSGMKSLLSSVNQIATALGKVENESDNLVKSLSALSKKDFSINFDFKMGKSASQISSEQGDIKRDAISQLKQQAKALEDYLDQYYKVAQKQEGVVKLTQGTSLFSDFWGMSKNIGDTSASLNQQVSTYKQYIDLMQEAAKIKGVDLSSVTSGFSKTTNDIVEQTKKVSDGVEEAKQALKGIFGGSLDVEGLSGQLQPIIADLGEIKTALQSLSSNNSIDGLTQSFNRLSETLEKLTANLTLAKNTLDTGFSNTAPANNAVKVAQQTGQKIGETISKSAKQSINIDDVIDEQVLDLMQTFSIAGDKGSNAFKEIRQALVECRNELNILKNSDIGIDEEVFDTSRAFDKVSDAIANQIRAVNSLGDEYVELAKYMKSFNDPKKGNKVRVPDFIKQEQGDDYKSTRGTLGIAFNTEKGISFASFIEDLNHELGIAIDLTNGEEKAYEELVHKLRLGREQLEAQKKSQTSLQASASTDDILTQNYINKNEIRDVAESAVDYINAAEVAEKALAQASTQSANTVAQNEERKQQAYKQTVDAVQSISKQTSLVRDGVHFQEVFDSGSQSAKEAQKYFQDLLADEKAVITVKESFDNSIGDSGALKSFTVDIQRATGEVEKLHYAMSSADDDNRFLYQGASVSDKNIEKQTEVRIKKANDLQIQLDKIKTGYENMGDNKPIKEEAHIKSLSEQYDKVQAAIESVKNSDNSTYTSMVSNAEKEKAALESLVKVYRDAETFSTDLRAKDRDAAREVYSSRLDVLSSKMRKDGVYAGLETDVSDLKTKISGASDVKALSEIANELTKLDAKYKSAKAAKDEFNRSQNVGSSVSGLKSDIEILQQASPSIKNFKTEINGAEVSIESLLKDLDQVGTKGDFDVVKGKVEAFGKAAEASGIDLNEAKAEAKRVNDAYKQMLETQKQIRSLSIKEKNLTELGSTNELNEVSTKLKDLKADYEALKRTFGDKLTSSQFGTLQAEIDETESELKQLDAKWADTKAKLANDIKFDIKVGNFDNEMDTMIAKFNSLSDANDDLRGSYNATKDAHKAMMDAADANTGDEVADREKLIQAEKKYAAALEKTNNLIKIQARADKIDADRIKLNDDINVFQSKVDAWLSKNSAATKRFGATMLDLKAKAEGVDRVTLNHLEKEFKQVDNAAEKAGLKGLSTFDRMKSKLKEYMGYFSVAEVFMYAEQGLRSMFEQVKLIDSAMTELKKVTNETDATYEKFLTNAADRAKAIGTTIDGLVSSTADFARLGYGFEDAQGLAEVANIYAVVGDEIEGVEGATESLISTMAAFKDEMNGLSDSDFAMSIVDKLNEVANNFSITSGGLGEALQRSASSLATGNNTLDESISLITAANEVVQNPEKVGNAMKTISMRIRSAKSEMEEMGEDTEGVVESTATLRAEIKALSGVDIMASATEFKSTYQILDELSQKWEDLNDISRATIIEKMAGKHQGNVFASLMENFDTARSALETSLNSSGSAMREHEKWQQSLEAQILKLKASWQGLSQAFLSSDFLKAALDGIIGLVDGLTKLIDTFGALPTLIGALSIFGSFKGVGFFKTIEDEATLSGKRIQATFIKALSGVFQNKSFSFNTEFEVALANDVAALQNYIAKLQAGVPAEEAFAQTMRQASTEAQHFAQTMNTATISASDFETIARQSQITEQAASFRNARTLINEYNGGLQNCKLTQKEFIDAVGKSNANFAKYLSGLNGAKASFGGYIASLVGAKVATLALEAATIAMNAALTMGVSLLISGIIKAVDKWIVTEEELAEKVEEVTSKFKEQYEELVKNKSSFISDAERYAELSKGVDNLGRNVSLTSEEFSEYQSVTNRIAEQIPHLVDGFDSQGTAILNCKDDVKALTDEYNKLIISASNKTLANGSDIFNDFQNKIKNANKTNFTGKKLTGDAVDALKNILRSDDIDAAIDKYAETGSSNMVQIVQALKDVGLKQKNGGFLGLGGESGKDFIKRAIEENRLLVSAITGDFEESLEADTSGMKSLTEAYFSKAFLTDYSDISELGQNVITKMLSSFDAKFYSKFEKEADMYSYFGDMLDALKELDTNGGIKNIEAAFDLQTQFNGGKVSYGEYVKGLETTGKFIDGLDINDELKTQIKLSLGLDEDGLVEEYQKLKNRLADSTEFNIMPSEYESFLNGLSAEEVSVLWEVIPKLEETDYKETMADIKAALEKEMMLQGLTFDLNLEVEAAGIEALNTALAESVTGSGLSSESIAALRGRYADLESQGYDLSAMFEETTHGIHINREEFNKLEKELSSQKIAKIDGDLKEMKNTYDKLGQQIRECDDPVRKSELFSERQLLGKRIAEAAELATQYKGLTSAYNDWLATEDAGQERDMYENIIEGFEAVGDEISRGWLDDGTIKFLELITGRTDLATLSAKELKGVWKDLDKNIKHTSYSVRDFFTVDEDGNSTSKGVYNFLDAIGQMEEEKFGGKDVVKREDVDGDGKKEIIGFDFQLVGGDKAVADALGISEELVQIMKRAAEDAGFVVSLDGTYKEYTVLENEARAAANTLKELSKENEKLKKAGGDFEFDFDTTSVKSLEEDLKQANNILNTFKDKDGNIDLKADGAIEAMQIVSTLQARLDDLKSEQYGIGLTVEDEEFEEPLENLQEYGRTVAELNQLKINPNVNSERIEQLEGELDNIAEEFNNLPDEKKIELGLVGKDGKTPLNNVEDIRKKIESGEVKIPTVLDIQANMDKNLEDLKKLALLGSGLLSDEQEEKIKLEILADVEVKADKVDTSDVEEKTDEATEKAAKGEEGEPSVVKKDVELVAEVTDSNVNEKVNETVGNENGETSVVKKDVELVSKVADSDVGEKVDEAVNEESKKEEKVEKTVEIDLIAKQANDLEIAELIKDYTPVKQKVIVEYFAEHSEVDKYTPEQKKALVEFIANSDNLDSYTPEEKQAIVEYLTNSADPDSWTPEQKEAIARFIRESGDVDSYTPAQKEAIAKFIRDSIDPDTYTPPSPTSAVTFNKNTSDVDSYDPPNFTRYVTYYAKKAFSTAAEKGKKALENRFGIVNGTANSDGSAFVGGTGRAFKQGDWRTKRTETALTGELGREIVVTPNNQWYTVGDNGAEFVNIPRGSIVFNHRQTEELLRNGKAISDGGRARALVNGTAFLGGTAHRGEGEWIAPEVESFKVGYDYKASSSDSDSKKSQEIFDWIEVAIERIEREIDNLDRTANNVYKSWSSRNKALADEIGEVGNEIALQQKAYEAYMSAANEIGLSSEWKKKVQSGAIDIDNVTDETLAEKIKDYQKYFEQALKCKDAIKELREEESKLYAQRFENIQTQYDGILQGYEHTEAMLNEYISQAEEQGYIVSKKYYQALINNEKSNIAELKKEQADLIAERDNAVAEGKITKGSEAWYEQCAAIDEVTQAIESGTTFLIEYNNAMRDIDWEIFDLIQERISDITAEADFLIDLMSNKKLFDDNGKLTEQGVATIGLHGQNYNTYMYQADDLEKQIVELDKQLAQKYDKVVEEKRRELVESRYNAILAAEDEKNAIKDLVEEGINLELDALQEKIDKKNEELEAEKDLYDYQKQVLEQTEEIASLEKQMASYSNDDSEEAKAKIQELKVSLEEAKVDLQETEWDRYIDQQSQLLDTLYTEYETTLNSRLDNIDYLIEQVIDGVNAAAGVDGVITSALGSDGAIALALGNNATTIKDTLVSETAKVGTTLSAAMSNIWNAEGNANKVITKYGDGFQGKQTTTNTVLNGIKANIDRMVDDVDKDAQKKVAANKTTTSAKKDPTKDTKPTTKPVTKPTTNKSSGDGKPKIGDKVTFVSGQYYYDSQGKKPLGSKYKGKQVYITNINKRGWATHGYHISTGNKLGKGDLGWLKLNQLSGYAVGKQNFLDDEVAWTQENGREFIVRPSDGAILTPVAKGDSVLNAAASNNIWDMANSPAEFIKENLGLAAANVPNNSNVNNSYTQNLENVVFNFPNVQNYEQLLASMQKDKSFEKLIMAMTIDRIAGGSSLAKGKVIKK